MISLKEKLVKHCIDLILISLKNTRYWLEHIIKKYDAFCYIVTYLGKILVIEWEISSLINDYFVVCIENNVTNSINNETIIQQFQIWKTRRRKL